MTKLDAGLITSLPASDPGSAAVWGSKRINPRPQFCLCLAWSGCPSNDDDDDDDDEEDKQRDKIKSASGRDFKTNEACKELQELSPDISFFSPKRFSKDLTRAASSKPIIHPLLPREQTRFLRGKSVVVQFVLSLNTRDLLNPFETKKKNGVVILL